MIPTTHTKPQTEETLNGALPRSASGEPDEAPVVNPPDHPEPDGEPDEAPVVNPPEQLPLPFEVAEVIIFWLPRASLTGHPLVRDGSVTESVVTEHILPSVRGWTETAAPDTAQKAREMLRASLGLAIWGWHTLGHLDESILWTPHNVELWAALVMEHRARGWRHQARGVLRRIGREVNPQGWPPERLPIGASDVAPPYEADDEEMFRAFGSLPGRKNVAGRLWLMCCTFGAGMNGAEAALAVPDDVVELPGGRLAVDVRGSSPRRVPVRKSYTNLTREALHAANGRKFINGGNQIAVNLAVHLIADRRVHPDADSLSLRRARNTWLVAHLRASTPLPALRRLAGRLSHRTLEALYQHVSDELTEEEVIEMGLRV